MPEHAHARRAGANIQQGKRESPVSERDVHSVVDELVDMLAERVAARVQARLAVRSPEESPWLTTREAAEHLGIHPDTLRRLAAERTIPSEQDGPGCSLHFRRSELDAWRESGGTRRRAMRSQASRRFPGRAEAA
jgi:excisionase family DNA binding protein